MKRQPNGLVLGVVLGTGLMLFNPDSSHASEVHRFANGYWYNGSAFEQRDFFAVDGVLREKWEGDATTVDLGGGWIVPGFGDAHSHWIGNGNYAVESERFIASGVFYVANPNSIASKSKAARESAVEAETVDARFANGGLTCSGGHPIQIYEDAPNSKQMDGDAYFVIDSLEMLDDRWPEVLAKEPDFLKIYLERSEHHAARKDDPAYYGKRGLDPQLVPEIVERAHEAGLRVTAHVTSRHDFRVAVEASVDEIAHLPLEPIEEEEARLAASLGTTVVTTILSHRPSEGVGDLDAVHRSNVEILRQAGVPLVLGTDSQATVVDEAIKILSLGVLEASELLRMLVHDTPRWIFPDRDIGRFVEGAEANFVVLESNPLEDMTALRRIQARYKSGKKLEFGNKVADKLPGIGQQLVHTLMARGVDAAIAEYRRLRTEEPDAWDFSEGQLNALGEAMFKHGKKAEATAIFELNIEQFPSSFSAWNKLGDSYAETGQPEKAKRSYERALELDPENTELREKLKQLEKM
jgi:imidazolonepropionase-like amidohydrolase